jgi:tetratricopeptide (TPR) repeat protein
MDQNRVAYLEEALRVNPDDRFARYALALELAQSEQPDAAWAHFDYLLRNHPDYAATYYQAGMFLWRRGRTDEARDVVTKGIDVTGRQGNKHAQSELQRALEELSIAT